MKETNFLLSFVWAKILRHMSEDFLGENDSPAVPPPYDSPDP